MASGMPSKGSAAPRARRRSDSAAMARARSGVSVTKAFNGRALSIAAM